MISTQQTIRPSRSDDSLALRAPAHAGVVIARMHWLTGLRWFYAGAMAALAGGVWLWRGAHDSALLLFGIALGLGLYNVIVLAAASGTKDIARLRRIVHVQIAADVLILIALLHVTGGTLSVLTAVLVFHVAVAASLLSSGEAYRLAALAAVAYAVLAVAHASGRAELHPLLPGLLGTYPQAMLKHDDVAGRALAALSAIVVVGGVMMATVYFTGAILARLRRINARLAEANRQLEALDVTKSRFLRISSHQLRGPLAAMHSLLSAIEAAGPLTPKQAELSQRIKARANEIMVQVDEMMMLSTIKESAAETQPCDGIELGNVLQEMVAQFAAESEQKHLSVSYSGNGSAVVCAWPRAVETIFENLLSNAVRYTPEGGSVSVTARHVGRRIEVDDADSGIGIPADQQERLFQEFFRATNARQVCGGTGLGLSIVKAIVERLGGEIRIKSQQDKGTTVTVSLPVE